jgi:hypothetical protein
MTEGELWEYFRDTSQRGIVAEEGGKVVGWTGWNRSGETGFYAHSTFCDGEHPHAYAALILALRKTCRLCGCTAIEFYIDTENAWYLKKVQQVTGVREVRRVFQMEVRERCAHGSG